MSIAANPVTIAGPAPSTYLFVPGHLPELIAKARRSAADAVVVDLEDAVAPEQRPAAREATAQALAAHAERPPATGQQLWVRINAAGSAEAEADLAVLGDLLTIARRGTSPRMASAETPGRTLASRASSSTAAGETSH